jgi:hypothetical protein
MLRKIQKQKGQFYFEVILGLMIMLFFLFAMFRAFVWINERVVNQDFYHHLARFGGFAGGLAAGFLMPVEDYLHPLSLLPDAQPQAPQPPDESGQGNY